MGKFLEAERKRQVDLKERSSFFSPSARAQGFNARKLRRFCLPREYADENLFREIRSDAPNYFKRNKIKWHDGQDDAPSNHLCSSQVCCVNFLYPFNDNPDALVQLFRPLFPNIKSALTMEPPDQFVSFEWIGLENYLGERTRGAGTRTRGANFTSCDAAVMFERNDSQIQIVLIEWKYTESYSRRSLRFSKRGTDRLKIYDPLLSHPDCPIDMAALNTPDDLFYDPFDQLMRQQLLAHEMEHARESGADIVSLLHIAPAGNTEFQTVTSPGLTGFGDRVTDVWGRLVRTPDGFVSASTEQLFGSLPISEFPELSAWWAYICERYTWMVK